MKRKKLFRIQSRNRHDQSVHLLANNPNLIDITNVTSELSIPFYGANKQLLGEADLIYKNAQGIYVVEYKCHDSLASRQKAEEQLIRARYGLNRNYGYNIEKLLYVHEQFIAEELTNGGFVAWYGNH